MKNKIKLALECIFFKEEGRNVILAPQLDLAFDGKDRRDLKASVKCVFQDEVKRWQQKNQLASQIKSRDLDASVPIGTKRFEKITVPLHVLKSPHTTGTLFLNVDV